VLEAFLRYSETLDLLRGFNTRYSSVSMCCVVVHKLEILDPAPVVVCRGLQMGSYWSMGVLGYLTESVVAGPSDTEGLFAL
jgi:hypothetical protein